MNEIFSKIGIIFNSEIEGSFELSSVLNKKISNSIIFSIDELNSDVDLALVIGGDGTFLKAARFYSDLLVPILGFNMGRLGYLTQAKPDDIDKIIENLKNKKFSFENRLMLKASVDNKYRCALNDIVIKGANLARTSTYNLFINGKNLCSYVADGLIVATPTGSTAYSLSAGGPIISPLLDCFIIIPICPHTLNTRPIVIPSNEIIKIQTLEKNQKLNVSFDGQVDIQILSEITIAKNDKFAKLLILDEHRNKFYDILKEKLHWSIPLGK